VRILDQSCTYNERHFGFGSDSPPVAGVPRDYTGRQVAERLTSPPTLVPSAEIAPFRRNFARKFLAISGSSRHVASIHAADGVRAPAEQCKLQPELVGQPFVVGVEESQVRIARTADPQIACREGIPDDPPWE
jgi:hypothetical protein